MAFHVGLILAFVSLIKALDFQESKPCAWNGARAGTVRDVLYFDGGIPFDGSGNSFDVSGTLYKFNYNTSFNYDGGAPNLLELLQHELLDSTRDAPAYMHGALFVDDFEFYTFGQVKYSFFRGQQDWLTCYSAGIQSPPPI